MTVFTDNYNHVHVLSEFLDIEHVNRISGQAPVDCH